MNFTRTSALAVLLVFSASCSKCKKPSAEVDAGPEAGPEVVDAAPDAPLLVDAAIAETPDASDAPPTTAGSTETGGKASGGPFAGSYKCNNGLTLSQSGNQVSGSAQTKMSTSQIVTTYACTVTRPDHCEGTAVSTTHFADKKKPPKQLEKRKLYLERRADGVFMRLEGSSEGTYCKK